MATPLVLRNYLLTMLLCGLWHGGGPPPGPSSSGAACTASGGGRAAWLRPLSAGCAWLATFAFVSLAWVFSRAPDLGTAWSFLKGVFALRGGWEPGLIKLPALAAAMLSWPRPLTALAVALMLLAVLLAPSPAEQKAFIYLQF